MRAGVGGDPALSAGLLPEPSSEAHWQGRIIIHTGTMGIMLRLRSTTTTIRRRRSITGITRHARTAAGAGATATAIGFADPVLCLSLRTRVGVPGDGCAIVPETRPATQTRWAS